MPDEVSISVAQVSIYIVNSKLIEVCLGVEWNFEGVYT